MKRADTGRGNWIRKATGWGLLAVGITGCILPVLPGVPLVLAGLLILAQDYLWAKNALGKVKRWAVHLRRKTRAARGSSAARAARNEQRRNVEKV